MFGTKSGGRTEKRKTMKDIKRNTTRKQRRKFIKGMKRESR